MTLALPRLSQMRQLPAFSPSPFQWWRQRIKRAQQISVQQEIRLAYFKCSCGLHHESPHSTMFCRPLKRALIAKFITKPALKGWAVFIRPLTRTMAHPLPQVVLTRRGRLCPPSRSGYSPIALCAQCGRNVRAPSINPVATARGTDFTCGQGCPRSRHQPGRYCSRY